MSNQVNTYETIQKINLSNDSQSNLGIPEDRLSYAQKTNGVDLINNKNRFIDLNTQLEGSVGTKATLSPSESRKVFDKMLESSTNVKTEENFDVVNTKPNHYVYELEPVREINYEDMYKDKICTFFIGSVSIVSLYVVFKLINPL